MRSKMEKYGRTMFQKELSNNCVPFFMQNTLWRSKFKCLKDVGRKVEISYCAYCAMHTNCAYWDEKS